MVAEQHQGEAADGVGLVRASDAVIFVDGRSTEGYRYFKAMAERAARGTKLYPKRPVVTVRLFFNNFEFLPGGFAAPARIKKTVSACLPDPLGNMCLVFPKNYINSLPLKPLKFLGITGDNRSRGWGPLALKGSDERELGFVPVSSYEAFFNGVEETAGQADALDESDAADADALNFGGAEDNDDNNDDDDNDDDNDNDADDAQDDGQGKEKVEPKRNVLFPWEMPEDFFRDAFNAFSQQPATQTKVVDFTASATAALACCHDKFQYLGLCTNEFAKTVIWEQCLLAVTYSMVLGTEGGFKPARRHLSRSGSLNGSESIATMAVPGGSSMAVPSEAGDYPSGLTEAGADAGFADIGEDDF